MLIFPYLHEINLVIFNPVRFTTWYNTGQLKIIPYLHTILIPIKKIKHNIFIDSNIMKPVVGYTKRANLKSRGRSPYSGEFFFPSHKPTDYVVFWVSPLSSFVKSSTKKIFERFRSGS